MSEKKVDQNAIRVNQAANIALSIAAFALDLWPLAAFVGVVALISAARPAWALFTLVYKRAILPAGLLKPDIIPDNPEPHRFAQALGGSMMLLGALLAAAGAGIGWALVWFVVALAALNLFAGFCMGCFMYYQLNRLGVPGFTAAPVESEQRP